MNSNLARLGLQIPEQPAGSCLACHMRTQYDVLLIFSEISHEYSSFNTCHSIKKGENKQEFQDFEEKFAFSTLVTLRTIFFPEPYSWAA